MRNRIVGLLWWVLLSWLLRVEFCETCTVPYCGEFGIIAQADFCVSNQSFFLDHLDL